MTQIDDIKSRVDIVELVASYVNLQRSGNSYKANCPFHQERTPSFYVFADRQSWRCFGACAEGGDALSFVMKAERLDFREALRRLGARVGVVIEDRNTSGVGDQLYQINDAARRYFQRLLDEPEGEFVRDYLADRGLNDQTIQMFELGYSPPRDNRLLAHLTEAGHTRELVAQAGLARETDDGRYYDLFRGRLIIPIRDWSGRVAGFGSRALDADAVAKYLNTPRTPVFDKSGILYAMHLAKEPVRQKGVVVVEGYMDAIMAHQHGFDNVVASMGTAVTEQQVALVRRLTTHVTMALDGDPAGRNATLRSLESSWGVFQQRNARASQAGGVSVLQRSEAMEMLVAELPSGQDPDDFIRATPQEWPAFVAGASPLFEYLLASLSARADLNNADDKTWVAQTMLRFVAQVPDAIRRDLYLDELSVRLRVNSETLRSAMRTVGRSSGRRAGGETPPATADAATPAPSRSEDAAEEYCLAMLLQHWNELGPEAAVAVSADWFERSEHREIYRSILGARSGVENGSNGWEMAEILVTPELEAHLNLLRARELMLSSTSKLEQAWKQIRLGIEKGFLNKEISQLMTVLQDEADWESPAARQVQAGKERVREINQELAGVA